MSEVMKCHVCGNGYLAYHMRIRKHKLGDKYTQVKAGLVFGCGAEPVHFVDLTFCDVWLA